MIRHLLLIAAVVLQGVIAASQQAPAATAALAGNVLNAVTGEPLGEVEVTLARTDMPLGAFAQMVSANNTGTTETILPGERLSAMLSSLSNLDAVPASDSERAQANALTPALREMPVADIREIIISPDRTFAVVRKSLQPVKTDSSGRFAFLAVEPGTYRVMFSAPGFANQEYGQRIADGKGIPVVVRAGERRTDLGMRLIPTGSVSGVVRNLNGLALAGIPVELLRFAYNEAGERVLTRAAAGSTDDRGAYRMFYLAPGRYYLSAGQRVSVPGAQRLRSGTYTSPNRIQESYALRYYPGVPDSYAASTIEVQPGADLTGVDMTLSPTQAYRLRGRVVDRRTGTPAANVSVWLVPQEAIAGDSGFSAGGPESYRPQDGTFEFTNVGPGAYFVTAALPEKVGEMSIVRTDRPSAATAIVVANSDVDGVTVELGNTGSLSGRLRLDPAAKASFTPTALIAVRVKNSDPVVARAGSRAQRQSWNINPDGSFTLDGLHYGEYAVSLAGLPAGFFLKEARLDQTDVLAAPMRFSGTETSVLDLVVSPSSGTVAGIATNAVGQPLPGARVVLIPAANRARRELFAAAMADSNGNYTLSSIAPGDYFLVAWEAIEPWAFFDPELIREAETAGTRVQVAQSAKVTLNVTAR